MDKRIIVDVLKKWNFWGKDIDDGIRRQKYIEKIYPYMDRKEILLIKGIRRSGKSTIAKQLMQELIKNNINKKQILLLNLEDYNFANNLNIKLFDQVLSAYKDYSKNNKKIYFFIDEIQKINGWEKWIRTKYDLIEDIKFIITGSSASLLSKELSTLLTGRNISFRIMPLSFSEYVQFSNSSSLKEYLKFGGFPEVVLENDEEKKVMILQQYFEDIIHKDIIDRYNIRNAKQLIEIARFLVSNAGSKTSLNKLSRVFGISKDTVSLYIGYMINAYLLWNVTFFSYSAKTKHDVTKLPKLYVLDNGLVYISSIKFSKNRGQMFENAVLIKLIEKNEVISYWSDFKSEVDFICGNRAINVSATKKISPREKQGLSEFLKKDKNFSPMIISEITNGNSISLPEFLKS